tara:strand:+ start:414 stop:695 length:282 start_codon:yes stop_codon:yes gene_type:complete
MAILKDQKLKVCPTCLRPNNLNYIPTMNEQKLLIFINDYKLKNQKSPTWVEMRDLLKFKATSNIHRIINKLKGHGFVDYEAGRKRSIEVLRLN